MKLLGLVCMGLCISAIFACEYHDRLREMARQRKLAQQKASALRAQAMEEQMRDLGRHQHHQDLAREQERALEDVRSSVYHPGRTREYRPSARTQLPSNARFCPGSSEYYCNVEAECRPIVGTDGRVSYTCSYTREPTVSRYPTVHRTSSRRYYPTERGHTHPSSGGYTRTRTRNYPYGPTYPGYYRHRKCTSGEKRVNITSTRYRCEDIDECKGEPCEQECRNTQGSFYCYCRSGYKRDGEFGCADRDECVEYNRICNFATCVNTDGSYTCDCPEGYEKQGKSYCNEIDECKTTTPCEDDEICFNLWGGFECSTPEPCPEGYLRSTLGEIDGACILEDSVNSTLPHAISYRKIAVEARDEVSSRPLGSMTFRSGYDNQYRHSFVVDSLSRNSKIRHEVASPYGYGYRRDTGTLKIDFYNRQPLARDERLHYEMLITDTPTRRYNYYYSNSRYSSNRYPVPQKSTRKVVITFVPMKHGNAEK